MFRIPEIKEYNKMDNKVENVNLQDDVIRNREHAETFRRYAPVCFIYAVYYTFCLYRNDHGITYPFFMIATIALTLFLIKRSGRIIKKESRFYILCLMLLSVSICTTASVPLHVLGTMFVIVLLSGLAAENLYETSDWNVGMHFAAYIACVFRPLSFLDRSAGDMLAYAGSKKSADKAKSNGAGKEIFIGICIAVPLLVIVLMLLMSADAVFGHMMDWLLNKIVFPGNAGDIFCILMLTAAVYIFSYGAYYMISSDKTENNDTAAGKKKGSPVTAMTVAVVLTAVYIVFCFIQIMYLFAGGMKLPDGYTYAEYVHEGFYQLVFVCMINLIIVLAIRSYVKQDKRLNIILSVFSACTFVMMASATVRMVMYVMSYGLSFLRLFVLWFILMMAVWFIAIIAGLFNEKITLFRFFLVSATVLYLLFAFVHPDYWIARYNIEAAGTDGYMFDMNYIENLSYDAVPAIMENPEAAKVYHKDMDGMSKDFRKFNFSEYRASLYLNR